MLKRKVIFIFVLIILLTGVFTNMYFRIEYDSNILDSFKFNKLSSEERQWLDEHGQLIYGADQNAPPLRYLDENTGQYKGIVIDYLRALSIELGVEIEFKPLVWEEALLQLEHGETDLCDMYPSPARSEVYLFTDPIYNQKSIILTKVEDKAIKSYKDLENKVVAAQLGDYAVEYLEDSLNKVSFNYTDDYKESIELLMIGQVDAVIGDEPVVSFFLKEMNLEDEYKIVEQPLFERESVLSVTKSEEMLQTILNKGIYNLKKKNTMEMIYQKWYGISAPFVKETIAEKIMLAVVVVISIIIMLIYIFVSWNKLLKTEVFKRTRELNASKSDLQTTFDSILHLMIVLDDKKNIVNTNKAFCNVINMKRTDIIGKKSDELVPFVITSIVEDTFSDGMSHQEELKYEGRIYDITTYAMGKRDESISKILVMARDVTKVRLSEQKLLQSNKIEAVGQLATGVAHEIRNPLGLIRNYCYILKNDLSEDNKDEVIGVIESSVEKASDIINNLLNFSRLSGDTVELVNIRKFMEDILKLEHKLMSRNNIDAILECDENIACLANKESLNHIFINLVSNAVDAMPNGGKLIISCRKESDDKLVLECSDNGTGIEKETIKNIFNPFFTTKAPGSGTGLGLYLTFNEVEKLNGEIKVESEIGVGTKFIITLPCEEE